MPIVYYLFSKLICVFNDSKAQKLRLAGVVIDFINLQWHICNTTMGVSRCLDLRLIVDYFIQSLHLSSLWYCGF